jgi:hypothetical protein
LKDARRCAFLGELDSEEESDENSDSDEFEFDKGNVPTEAPSASAFTSSPVSVDPVQTTPIPRTITSSREALINFMTRLFPIMP